MVPFDAALLGASLVLATPILLAALGELVSERAGVVNVGLEGMMLMGAFFSFLVAWKSGSLALGVAGGIAAGIALAAVMGLLTITAKADQIVAGIGLLLLAAGLTSFLFEELTAGRDQVRLDRIDPLEIPLLSDIPEIGPALFDRDPIVYVAFLLVPAIWFLLYRTRWGLSIRSAGEAPAALDTAGVSVVGVRWAGVLTAGALAGLGGAFLSIAQLGLFQQNMTAGRGFLALAAVFFGRWHPLGVLAACLLFGAADALQLRLQGAGSVPSSVWVLVALVAAAYLAYRLWDRTRRPVAATALAVAGAVVAAAVVLSISPPEGRLPSQLWLALPFLLALLVLAGAVGRARVPAALMRPYRRDER